MSTTPTSTGSKALVCVPAARGALIEVSRVQTAAVDATALAEQFDALCTRMIELVDRAEQTKGPGALSRYVAAAWSRLIDWRMRRATRAVLAALDDRILKDIGLERGEIDRVLGDMQRATLHGRALMAALATDARR
jgi:uncharacterized protein YjiS (DUF1127 family)